MDEALNAVQGRLELAVEAHAARLSVRARRYFQNKHVPELGSLAGAGMLVAPAVTGTVQNFINSPSTDIGALIERPNLGMLGVAILRGTYLHGRSERHARRARKEIQSDGLRYLYDVQTAFG